MRLRPREIHLLLVSIDLIILNSCFFFVAYLGHFENKIGYANQLLLVLNISYILISVLFIENLRDLKSNYRKMVKRLSRRFVYYFAFTSLILPMLENDLFPRTQYVATILLFFAIKFCLSSWVFYRFFFNTHLYLKPTVIIGDNKLGGQLLDYFQKNKYLGIKPIGVLSENRNFTGQNVIGSVEDFQAIFDRKPFEDAFIAIPLTKSDNIMRLIAVAERNGVRTHLVPNYSENEDLHFKVGNLGNIPLLQMRTTPLDTYSNIFVKRAFDIIFASIMVILLAPLGLFIALVIKLTSKGPVFFRSQRLGLGGTPFSILKFRTMRHAPGTENRSTVANDERITKFGKFLRKNSLDELPQLLNVLMNDMSVIGPRPHRINLNKSLQSKMTPYMMRHTIKPGITGWAQVNGWRGPTETKLQRWGRTLHDLWYIEHWTFWLDIYIILLTFFGRKTRINAF